MMNVSLNGESHVPPGFRFHPTEEELLHYYLKKKVASEKIDLDVIRNIDLNKLEPWDIQEKCKIGSSPQNDWYFFSHKDKKYPTGTRTNRATAAGFWKATGRDKVIYSNCKRIGMRKTLVFYKGRAPHGEKSDWIMHEYRLDDHSNASNSIGDHSTPEEGWVVCRVFKKKNYQKALENSTKNFSTSVDLKTHFLNSSNEVALQQILSYMSNTCKQQGFMHLPQLDSLTFDQDSAFDSCYESIGGSDENTTEPCAAKQGGEGCNSGSPGLNDWVTLDRLVASQLNGQAAEATKQLPCFADPDDHIMCLCLSPEDHDCHNDTRCPHPESASSSSLDPMCRLLA
ncbi:hypothetical protein Nepgr_024655 [Nepenthes gracilis]|uniref:NAC domain-containing protein n=1 Tax=Nepenthes gracilis TaxID=150966 RepID=A0AAD3XYU0_NEPGR|nr:hypothetical protein Nepgr_024655 [Nepenthes gracilis]